MQKKDNPSTVHVTDRRFWAQEDSGEASAPTEAVRYPTVVEELKARTELAERKLKERLQELNDESEAFRRRLAKEMDRRLEQEKLEVLRSFLEIGDNFERALEAAEKTASFEALKEGVHLNLELFLDRLQALGVEPIEVLNKPFNPEEAEAVGSLPVDDPALDEHVAEVVLRGFRRGDQILRPAKVRVGQYSPTPSEDPAQGPREETSAQEG